MKCKVVIHVGKCKNCKVRRTCNTKNHRSPQNFCSCDILEHSVQSKREYEVQHSRYEQSNRKHESFKTGVICFRNEERNISCISKCDMNADGSDDGTQRNHPCQCDQSCVTKHEGTNSDSVSSFQIEHRLLCFLNVITYQSSSESGDTALLFTCHYECTIRAGEKRLISQLNLSLIHISEPTRHA